MDVAGDTIKRCITPALRTITGLAMQWLQDEIGIQPDLSNEEYCGAVQRHFVGSAGEPFWSNLSNPQVTPMRQFNTSGHSFNPLPFPDST